MIIVGACLEILWLLHVTGIHRKYGLKSCHCCLSWSYVCLAKIHALYVHK